MTRNGAWRLTTGMVLMAGLGLTQLGAAHAMGEQPVPAKAPAKPEPPAPTPQALNKTAKPKPAPKKAAPKKAVAKKTPVKKATVKHRAAKPAVVAAAPLKASPGMKYDVGHMPVPSSVSAPVQAGGTAEGLLHPSPALKDAPNLPPGVPAEIMAKAKPGQCFAELMRAPVTELADTQVMVAPARKVRREFPAQTEWVDESVVIKPGRTISRHIPATYRMVRETVVVSPAETREERVEAEYETRRERELIAPERQEWVFVPAAPTGGKKLDWNGKTPEGQWCLQTIPARYDVIERRVEVRSAGVRRIELAPVTKVIERRIVDVPAHEEVTELPPVMGTRKVKRIIEPARSDEVALDPVYETRKVAREVSPESPVWTEVLCVKSASPQTVKRLQGALKAKGYYKGKPDGVLGTGTVKAMDAYQTANGLPRGAITVDGLKALGVY